MDKFISGLNDAVLNYINEFEVYDFSELGVIDNMSTIILSSKVPCFKDKIKTRFGLSKSLELAYEFYNFLGSDYGQYYLDRIGSDDIIYAYDPKGIEVATSYHVDGEKKIFFPYCENICDSFTITHEMFHDMNLDVDNINYVRDLFTEYISIFSEMLFNDFISDNYDIKCSYNNRYTFNSCYVKAVKVRFYLELVKCFLDNGYINDFDFNSILDNYNSYYHDYLLKSVGDIVNCNKLSIIYEYRYLLGILLSCYSKDLIGDGKFNVNMFKYINENINDIIPEDIYDFLSLDIENYSTLELSFESYEKLRKSYIKIMGRV